MQPFPFEIEYRCLVSGSFPLMTVANQVRNTPLACPRSPSWGTLVCCWLENFAPWRSLPVQICLLPLSLWLHAQPHRFRQNQHVVFCFFSPPRSFTDPISRRAKLLWFIWSSSSLASSFLQHLITCVTSSPSPCVNVLAHTVTNQTVKQRSRETFDRSESENYHNLLWGCVSPFCWKTFCASPRSRILWGCLLNVCFTARSYEFRCFIYPLPLFFAPSHALPHRRIQRILDIETTVSQLPGVLFFPVLIAAPCWWINGGRESEKWHLSFFFWIVLKGSEWMRFY